jgi:hypothetical protein
MNECWCFWYSHLLALSAPSLAAKVCFKRAQFACHVEDLDTSFSRQRIGSTLSSDPLQ